MIELVGRDYIKLKETEGIIQNTSSIHTLELSDMGVPDSGIFIYPLEEHSFHGTELFVRCIDGTARVRVVPFKFDKNRSSVLVVGKNYSIAHSSDISGLLNNIFGMEE